MLRCRLLEDQHRITERKSAARGALEVPLPHRRLLLLSVSVPTPEMLLTKIAVRLAKLSCRPGACRLLQGVLSASRVTHECAGL